jgi:hypothetical protein
MAETAKEPGVLISGGFRLGIAADEVRVVGYDVEDDVG